MAGGRWCGLTPVAQPVPALCGAQRRRRARSPGTASVCRGPGRAADTGRLCAARAVTSGAAQPAFFVRVNAAPRRRTSPVSASRAARGAHRHATATTARPATTASPRGAHRHHSDEPPATRPGRHCARRADHRLAALPRRRARRESGQPDFPSPAQASNTDTPHGVGRSPLGHEGTQ